MINVKLIFYRVKLVVCNMQALLPTHFVIARTNVRIEREKLKKGLKICRQIYFSVSFLMGIMFFWKIVQKL